MKRLAVITMCLIFSVRIFSQGIEFRQGTWKQMLDAAQAENKMVFIDFSTVWCGVCKIMVKNIFSQEKVSKFYNENFICYKLDAEVGEGKEIARKYEVGAFPTFLFVDGEGVALYKCVGYMEADAFIAKGEAALKEFTSGRKTIETWEAEYIRKKNDAAFVRQYLDKRESLQLDNADILDQYVRIAGKKELMATDFLNSLLNRSNSINAAGPSYRFITGNLPEISRVTGKKEENLMFVLKEMIIGYSLKKAIRLKDEDKLQSVLEVAPFFADNLGYDVREYTLELKNRYYFGIGDANAFEQNSIEYVDYISKDKQRLLQADSIRFSIFLNDLIEYPGKLDSLVAEYNIMSGPLDETILRRAFTAIPCENTSKLAYKLMDVVGLAVRISDRPEYLLQVLSWAVDAVTLVDNFNTEGTLAEVFYALGLKEEAIARMKEARRKAIVTMKSTQGFPAQLLKKIQNMENNEPLVK